MSPHLFEPHQLLELNSFDTAFAVPLAEEDDVKRRYMTLLVEEGEVHRGASSVVLKVSNTECTPFALKVLSTDDLVGDEREQLLPVRTKLFAEEYRAQAAVSHLSGFPKLYGFGMIDDVPVILMEWVDGMTLKEAAPLLPADIYGRTDAAAVAGIGIAVLKILDGAKALDENFVHRDLSPRNILLRLDKLSLEEQAASGAYSPCLIDLGSASITSGDPSITMTANIWRNGTPDYAPPEMLTNDAEGLSSLRTSRSIDVYALCSILYELYAQHTPFGLGVSLATSPYRMKMDNEPIPLAARTPRDQPLVDAIMAGIKRKQQERINGTELLMKLESWMAQQGGTPLPAAVPEPEEGPETSGALAVSSHLSMPASPEPMPEVEPVPETLEAADTPDASEARRATADSDGQPPAKQERARFSRRAFVAGACTGIAAVTLGGAAIATQGFGLLRPKTVDDYSWEELSTIARKITDADDDAAALEVARSYGFVDEDGVIPDTQVKSLQINGIPHHVRLIGIAHDDLADGSGKAGLTFMLDEIYDTIKMNDVASYEGAWKASALRSWLNNHFTLLLPEDLAGLIRPVLKMTNNVGGTMDAASVTQTEETAWLFSYCELVGARERVSFSTGYEYLADILNGEGEQYSYFRDRRVLRSSPSEHLVRNEEDEPGYWWLRSASPDVSLSAGEVNFNRVGPNGDPFHFATVCTEKAGLVAGFCL